MMPKITPVSLALNDLMEEMNKLYDERASLNDENNYLRAELAHVQKVLDRVKSSKSHFDQSPSRRKASKP
jgi:regulator of replication initiation timing